MLPGGVMGGDVAVHQSLGDGRARTGICCPERVGRGVPDRVQTRR